MIEIFLLFFGNCGVTYTDRIPEIITKYLLNFFQFFIYKCIAELIKRLSVIFRHIGKPLSDFFNKKISNLPVWNHKTVFSTLRAALVCQISRCKKYTP